MEKYHYVSYSSDVIYFIPFTSFFPSMGYLKKTKQKQKTKKHVITMVAILNYLKRLHISYLTRLMGFIPIVGFLVELLHRLVPSQMLSYALDPSLGIALDRSLNMWISYVHPCCNGCNGFSFSEFLDLILCLLPVRHNLP